MTATAATTSNAATMPGPDDGVPTFGTGAHEVIIREARGVPTAKLCTHCLEYNFSRETLNPRLRPGGLDGNAVFTTFGKLVKSSTTCPLCKLILEGLENKYAGDNEDSLKDRVSNDSEVFVSMWREYETTISFFIIPPEVKEPRHPIPRLTESNLRVYQGIGDWARSPPLIPWSEPCVNRLKQWLSECLEHHRPKCCTMRSGGVIDESLPPVLPSRVIDVGPLSGSMGARLIESNGRRGYYTALSYCWGSSQKADRPYLTTTKTLEKHLSALPWDLLPKTLQDAIRLTRAIGGQYLWIDSLCIIQDSNDDWEKEAARMGTLYAQARLVIAATTGGDAEAGLFPFQTFIRRPSKTSFSLFFSKLPKERRSPQHNLPLFTRGWAIQEWVLARRIVFWIQDRMWWYCAGHDYCVGDDGCFVSRSSGLLNGYTTWMEIVTQYSGRELTYPTDKLIAISGIANELHKKRPEDKYVFGCWQSEIHWEVLWSGQTAHSTDSGLEELRIPSWSWACHPGGVQFLQARRWTVWEIPAQSSVSFLEDSSLQIMARTKTVDFDKPDMVNDCLHWFRHENGALDYDQSPLPECLWYEVFAMLSLEVGHGSVQIAFRQDKICIVFDSRDFLDTYQKERNTRQCGKMKQAIEAIERGSGLPAGIADEFAFVEMAQGYDYLGDEMSVGLLLRNSPHTPGRYIRVGLGFAFESWFKDAKEGKFVVE